MFDRYAVVCCLLTLCLTAVVSAQEDRPSIAEMIARDDQFTVLQRMLDLADPQISTYLDNAAAQLTFFAPTNEAMEAVFGETFAHQQAYADAYPYRVNEIIRFHIIPTVIDFNTVSYAYCNMVGTAQINAPLVVYMDERAVTIAHEDIPASFISSSNGVIYPINRLLPQLSIAGWAGDHTPDELKRPKPYPPHFIDVFADSPFYGDELSTTEVREVLETDGRFEQFLRLLDAAPTYEALLESGGLYTIFIPTDAAFEGFAENTGFNLEAFSAEDALRIISQRTAPGYITPDYMKFYITWQDRLSLCTLDQATETLEGQATTHLEAIEIGFNEENGFTANGGTFDGGPIYARNALVYVTHEYAPTPFRG